MDAVFYPSNYQKVSVEKTGNFTAETHGRYNITATATVTDPTPAQGMEYICFVRNGTATIGGTAYAAGTNVLRSYHSGSWANSVFVSLSGATPLTAARIPFASAGGFLTDSASLSWSGTLLTVTGGITMSGALSGVTTLAASGVVSLTNTTNSTSSTTGALVLSGGGIGAAGSIYSAGNLACVTSGSGAFIHTYTANDSTTKIIWAITRGSGSSPAYFNSLSSGSNDVSGLRFDVGGVQALLIQAAGITMAGGAFSKSATAGIGYSTGAGGAVAQATSRTTGVTLNKVSGAITLVSAAGSTTPQTFTVTNSAVAATDTITVSQQSGSDKYHLLVTSVAAGSFQITAYTTGGTTTETPVINFNVIKGVAA